MERISDTGLVVPKGVSVRSIKYGGHRFSDRKVIGLTTGIEFETGALKIDVAIAAEADCKYHDMLAEAVDGGSRKNRINGVYVVSLPNGGREDAVVIGADAIQSVLDGRSPARLFSAMPNVL